MPDQRVRDLERVNDEVRRRRRRTWITRAVVSLVVASVLGAWAFAVSDTIDVAAVGTEAVANLTLSEALERVAGKLGGMTMKVVGGVLVGAIGLRVLRGRANG